MQGMISEMQNNMQRVMGNFGGSAWESNPPSELLTRYTGFEVRESHQCPIHFLSEELFASKSNNY